VSGRYAVADAARDLAAAGLLRAVLVADGASWTRVGPAAAPGAFHGATLDSRAAREGILFVGLPGTRVDGRRYAADALVAGATALVGPGDGASLAPGGAVPPRGVLLVSDAPQDALAVLGARWRDRHDPVLVGITGSNGKTTTKDLLGAMLAGAGPTLATAGNYNSAQGVPITLLALRPEHRYAVVEMGASAVGHIADLAALARPRIGVITVAAGAHLETFGSLDGVIEGKGEMVAGLPPDGTAILNADSPGFERWCERAPCPVVSFGATAGDHRWSWQPGPPGGPAGVLDLDGDSWPVPLPGRHNAANLCAAILAGRAAGAGDRDLRHGLVAFAASPHRGTLRRLAGRSILDDCYNANPASLHSAAVALLELPGGTAWAVLGAMAELGPDSDRLHHEAGADLHAVGVERVVAVGEATRPLAEGFAAAGRLAEVIASHDAAADLLASATRPGDRILVKGSRSATMERVLEALGVRHGWSAEEDA
jgi:UDP-N-acetylmuramoyl-tripeptide--D-alanyl-D-alanine ligase